MPEYRCLALNLRRLRAERLITQTELATRVCVHGHLTQQYISGLERGLWPTRAEHVSWLALALCVPESELLQEARLQPFPVAYDAQPVARATGPTPGGVE